MQYHGKLYGSIGNRRYFDTGKTSDDFDSLTERVNELEEWLTEYRDQLKKENVFHKNTGIINAINELLNPELYDTNRDSKGHDT